MYCLIIYCFILYVSITNSKVNNHQVEQVWCTFTKGTERFHVGYIYQPQTLDTSLTIDALATTNKDNSLFGSFTEAANLIDWGEFSSLAGDFNYNSITCSESCVPFCLIWQTLIENSFSYIRIAILPSMDFLRLTLRMKIHELLIFSSPSLNVG